MLLTDAIVKLPQFDYLKGYNSESFNATIDLIHVSFQDPRLAISQFECIKQGRGFPHLQSDEGHYTIVAALSNGDLVSIKRLVLKDKLEDLYSAIELIDDQYALI